MKSLALILCLTLFGCANIKQSPTPIQETRSVKPEQLPTEDELAEQQLTIIEEQSYQKSLDQINQKMSDEYSQYKDCLDSNKPKKACKKLLDDFCDIDPILDTRQGYHYKPYCRNLNK